jgi:hypothetical protein
VFIPTKLFEDQLTVNPRPLKPRPIESQLNSPNMGYGSTSPSQNELDREKHADAAQLSTQSSPGEPVACSDNVTAADKPSPRNIHGWKVGTPPQHLHLYILTL